MQIRRSILLLSALFVVLIVLAWLFTRKPAEIPLATSIATNTTASEGGSPQPTVSGPASNPSGPTASASAAASNQIKPSRGDKAQQMQGILSTYNDVPIDFYGKLEDQFANPIGGAEIKGSIRVNSGVKEGTDWLATTSDANGLFQFHGKGQDIGMMPSKTGYAYVSMNGTGNYSHLYPEEQRAHPDPNNPVIIKMWKLQGAERLVHFQAQVSIPVDGTPRAFDLKTGAQVASGGDIIVSVKSSGQPDIRQQYNWEVSIQGAGGGLLVSSNGFEEMFQAPDSGYEPKFVVAYQKGVSPWSTTFNGVFYFTSRDGRCYGKLGIEVLSDVVKNGTVPLILNSYLNTAGSRNLEIESNLVTEARP